MLYAIIGVLIILWIIGQITAFTAGGLIHILLVVAVIMFVFNLVRGRSGA
jgi:hypothetical protein